MINILPIGPQGWECPKCGHVYSPSTPMCFTCPIKLQDSTSANDNAPVVTWRVTPVASSPQPQPDPIAIYAAAM